MVTVSAAREPTVTKVPATKPFFMLSFFLKGLRFITPKAFSELLKLSREYQMLTVTKRLSVDLSERIGPTSSVEQRNESKVTERFANFDRYSIALQANRAESLPFVSIRVASLL